MSRASSGPSSRPLNQTLTFSMSRQNYSYQPILPTNLPFQMNEAPKLKEKSLLSRMCTFALLLLCVSPILILIIGALKGASLDSLWNSQSINSFSSASAASSTGSYDAFKKQPHSETTKQHALKQKSILRKLSLLKRSSRGNGVDLEYLKQLFPHWFDTDENSSAEKLDSVAAVSDIALALSQLLQIELQQE